MLPYVVEVEIIYALKALTLRGKNARSLMDCLLVVVLMSF
jgi:hypothetical protein